MPLPSLSPSPSAWSTAPSRGNSISAPSDRPSQLRCAVVVESDQSILDLSSRLASSRSAYSVIRKNHCSSVRCSTMVPQRSQAPLITCSFASTVLQLGHRLTGAAFLYAFPALKSCTKIHCVHL